MYLPGFRCLASARIARPYSMNIARMIARVFDSEGSLGLVLANPVTAFLAWSMTSAGFASPWR